jgi:hypothetical protein
MGGLFNFYQEKKTCQHFQLAGNQNFQINPKKKYTTHTLEIKYLE